ncbi:MAG TPA: cobalt-precorrin-5B (C(1))-methyltransferase [Methanoregulaceae archaeon]|nr:cobalt-precorrin-5B (C(1))-methyltransferase [Methanoregulaceae archaeon]
MRLTDPVTGFSYPEAWIEKCHAPDDLEAVKLGLAVLTASGMILKRGFTTGTTAAASCKAAILSLKSPVNEVKVKLPCGISVTVPVTGSGGQSSASKYPGDYPGDVTAGLEFLAVAQPSQKGMELVPGDGIGIFNRHTPRNRKGDPAISIPALDCILRSADEALEETGLDGVSVTLSVPRGRDIAKKTLNPRMGVCDGISILGTTGFVEPWDDHLTESAIERAVAPEKVVLTTGRTGLRYSRLLFPGYDIVLAGGKIGEILSRRNRDTVLCGLPALILKFFDPAILDGTGCHTVEELAESQGFRERMEHAFTLARKHYPGVRVVLVNREGEIVGDSG